MSRPYHKRRARRIKYKRPIAPPFRWFLKPAETCLSLGISRLTLQRWMHSWAEGRSQGPEPFVLSLRKDSGDSGEAERLFRKEAERHSGMIPNTIGA